jgi:hypothetical protein
MIAPHRIRVEDDVIFFSIHGDITESHMRALIERGNTIAERSGQYWLIADVRELTTVQPDARRLAATNPRRDLFRGAAITGGSPVVRTLILLIARAMRLLGSTHIEIVFVATEAEGQRWVADQKSRRL